MEDEKLIKLITGDVSGAILACTILAQLGEPILSKFVQKYGEPIDKRFANTPDLGFRPRYIINRNINLENALQSTYIKFKGSEDKIGYIFIGHCVSVFTSPPPTILGTTLLIDLTK